MNKTSTEVFFDYKSYNDRIVRFLVFSKDLANNESELHKIDDKIKSIVNSNVQLISVIIKESQVEWNILSIGHANKPTGLSDLFLLCSKGESSFVKIDRNNSKTQESLKKYKIPRSAILLQKEQSIKIKEIAYPIFLIEKKDIKEDCYFFEKFCEYTSSFQLNDSPSDILYKDEWGRTIFKSSIPHKALNQKTKSARYFLICLKRKKIKLPKYLSMEILSQARFFYWKKQK